jgi:hypothetical protein
MCVSNEELDELEVEDTTPSLPESSLVAPFVLRTEKVIDDSPRSPYLIMIPARKSDSITIPVVTIHEILI